MSETETCTRPQIHLCKDALAMFMEGFYRHAQSCQEEDLGKCAAHYAEAKFNIFVVDP